MYPCAPESTVAFSNVCSGKQTYGEWWILADDTSMRVSLITGLLSTGLDWTGLDWTGLES